MKRTFIKEIQGLTFTEGEYLIIANVPTLKYWEGAYRFTTKGKASLMSMMVNDDAPIQGVINNILLSIGIGLTYMETGITTQEIDGCFLSVYAKWDIVSGSFVVDGKQYNFPEISVVLSADPPQESRLNKQERAALLNKTAMLEINNNNTISNNSINNNSMLLSLKRLIASL